MIISSHQKNGEEQVSTPEKKSKDLWWKMQPGGSWEKVGVNSGEWNPERLWPWDFIPKGKGLFEGQKLVLWTATLQTTQCNHQEPASVDMACCSMDTEVENFRDGKDQHLHFHKQGDSGARS